MRILAILAAGFMLLGWASTGWARTEPPPLAAYGQLSQFRDATLSPSGNRQAVIVEIEGQQNLVIIENKEIVKISLIGDVKVRSLSWASENDVLVVVSNTQDLGPDFTTEKAEIFTAFVIPVSVEAEVRTVFARHKDILNAVFGEFGIRFVRGRRTGYFSSLELRRSNDSIGMTSYVFDHGRPALFAVDLASMKAEKIATAAEEGEWRDWIVDADGNVAATLKGTYRDGNWRIENAQGNTVATGQNPTGGIGLMALGGKGRTVIFYRENPTNGENTWHEVPLDGSTEPQPFLDEIEAERIHTDPDTGYFVGYQLRNDENVMLDPAASKRFAMVRKAFPNLRISLEDWTRDFSTMLVRTDGNGDSGTWYRVDLEAKTADAIGYERLRIPPDAVGPVSTFAYQASDGLELDGILTLPPGREAKNLPIIMLPHGGPHYHDEEGFDWWAQAFASRGYAVFQPNFRGSTNRDSAFERAGYGQWGRKMQTDISDGLSALAEAGIADNARACIVGASYGGYAALAGVTIENGKYRCAVAVAPVADLSLKSRLNVRAVGLKGRRMRTRILEEMLGPRSAFDEVSPMKLADRADAPILLIHGRDDTVVPYLHSQKMADALKDAGKPYEFVELEAEDHWLSQSTTRLQMLKASVAFVKKHNPAD